MATVSPLNGAFGAEISGLDLSQDADDGAMRLVTQTLYANQVVVIRGQELDRDQYLRFGSKWGTPIPHVLDHLRMPGYPTLMTLGNTEKRDRDPKIRNGAILWHTDQSYEAVPATATMLYSIVVPRTGGETQFCNMVAAYDELDEQTKVDIDALEMAHKYGLGQLFPDEAPAAPIINEAQDRLLPAIYHPLVMPHPISGTKALYALGHGAHGIRGMDDEAAESLIAKLKTHVVQEKFVYRHKYDVGDVVVWDTLQTMHRATPIDVATNTADSRCLWRISVRGKPQIYS